MGGCTLSNVRRGVTQCCALGYWIGERFARQGYMFDACKALCRLSSTTLGLHRIEAACLPQTSPRRICCARSGFREEGLARRYLLINGEWRDHVLFALLADEAQARLAARVRLQSRPSISVFKRLFPLSGRLPPFCWQPLRWLRRRRRIACVDLGASDAVIELKEDLSPVSRMPAADRAAVVAGTCSTRRTTSQRRGCARAAGGTVSRSGLGRSFRLRRGRRS